MHRAKKLISIVLALITVFSSAPFAFADENVSNLTDAVIVIDSDASITDNYAAEKLKYYLD
ncbi:MAG: hypothetical protein J6R20_01135, partial [Clostridia bacterium]|nr:hypothetical protein [Clostridia bacterium]